ncbi:hypothetical protein LPJ78_000884 [Coemansia sp. RSA 989]|nr:putative glucose-6-phosphate 1-epimerase-like protein [Coemansia mojavensis]KAJ1743495.1 hypothetical protein LPJ68_000873 [Coemansia sp. RSA 1086]KAJ1753782.1 hypothetical protein LPJ79_000069 [Coemansia sp. RSA 1821]KAJ1867649.1 hypothetical protein LPJ78_000884 [Coemansia sp. RSA 989]KAJ1875912.1 hypothetical protein LPJ55_000326 [Coemansia sp. RSA 990]KAJ2653795.1 hypothetical protein IWW40_000079 [Coemansia sp. RSA 1250]KAJ2676947.1 hypothetical protein IWW42_000285 [Coemansia sp. RSA
MPANFVEKINGPDGSLEKVVLHGEGDSQAEIYLFGATVTSWKSQGKERLFLSKQAKLDGSKAIRGGIPLVFPQFGPGELPQHGFARTRKWSLIGTKKHGSGVIAQFELTENADTLASNWPYRFVLRYTVTMTKTTLSTIIEYENNDTREFSFTSLMHTYFRVPSIDYTVVGGLKNTRYADKVKQTINEVEPRNDITIAANEDRVYENVPGVVDVRYGGERVTIKRFNFKDIVLWNPWVEKAQEMSDFGDAEYKEMVCVEAGTVASKVELRPGQTISCGQLLTVEGADN